MQININVDKIGGLNLRNIQLVLLQNHARMFIHVYPRRAHESPAGAQPAVFT